MDHQIILRLDVIAQLKTWDDRFLVKKTFYREIFEKWKAEPLPNDRAQKRMEGLIDRHHFSNVKLYLRPWIDLAFSSGRNFAPTQEVKVTDRLIKCFVRVQFALFNNGHDNASRYVREERRNLGLPEPIPAAQISTERIDKQGVQGEKRGRPIDGNTGQKRRRIEDNENYTNGRADILSPKPTPSSRFSKIGKTRSRPGHRLQASSNSVQSKDLQRTKGNESRGRPDNKSHSSPKRTLISPPRENWKKEKRRKATTIRRTLNNTAQPHEHFDGTYTHSDTTAQEHDLKQNQTGTLGTNPKNSDSPSNDCFTVQHAVPKISSPIVEIHVTEKAFDEAIELPSLRNWLQEPVGDGLVTGIPNPGIEFDEEAAPPVSSVKSPLDNYPPIWAQSRQEVCESFDWFRSYQGGVYHARNVARGYLLSAFSARRDKFEYGGKLIISHGGGKAQSIHIHHRQSVAQEAEDQLAKDKSVQALLSNFRSRRPLVLLIDDKYALFPYDLGSKDVTYAVLGFYTIVHAWAEYQLADNERGRVVRYKFAFQWCESQGEPWWLKSANASINQYLRENSSPGAIEEDMDVDFQADQSTGEFEHIKDISRTCKGCHRASPQIYTLTWTCLEPECNWFWQDENGFPLREELEYNPEFLKLAPNHSLAIPTEELAPEPPLPVSQGPTTDYAYTRGWHCRNCGRLSSRFKWEFWECMHCKAVLPVRGTIRSATEFLYLTLPVPYRQCHIADNSGIVDLPVKTFQLVPGDAENTIQCFTYELPESRGRIHHIKTGHLRCNQEADTIFQDYQIQALKGALPFRRWPMRAHKCRGTLLTNYFSQNAGVPYQYVGGTDNTLSFDQVPDVIVRARKLIEARVNLVLGKDAYFNEVLSAAYMERQRMAFHTDNEVGLGPLVAGLSLGSPALMHFRLLAKHTDPRFQRNIAISIILRHGDVLAMDGAGVQQYYEHTVVPTNFRIAATARYIDVTHLKP